MQGISLWTTPSALLRHVTGVVVVVLALVSTPAMAAGGGHTEEVDFSFKGPFGGYDRGELQRGFQIYKEVCASCHALSLVAFRNLSDPGGPGFSEAEVKALAAQVQVEDGPDDVGDMYMRPGRPSDRFPSPFPNEQASRAANSGAYPPDLSVMAKAREGGADHIYAILTNYGDAPEGFKELPIGQYYNSAMDDADPTTVDGVIAMAPPLSDGIVTYADGTEATVEQMARDVSTFLMWTAEPKMEMRKRIGFQVMVFLAILAGLLFFAMRRTWRDQH